ncbi:MAG: glycosyltransferase family 2 protein [Micrococcales bacterium]
MKTFVTAIIVSHNSSDFLDQTIAATKFQNIDQLIIIETGDAENPNAITAPGASLPEAIALAERNAAPQADWLWILHDDSAPMSNALKELLNVVELSPSVAVVGPKLMDWNNRKLIAQQGLTLTRSGALFSLVSDELDQSQHDGADDVLAVGTAGMLVKRSVWQSLGGLTDGIPPLAADVDFSIRARLAGHRVVVAPQSKVAHAALALHGKRNRSWLRVEPKSALRRAELQLRLSYASLATALLFWFFLPLLTLGRLVWRVWSKRPDRLIGDLAAGAWAYFTIGARLRHRRKVSVAGRRALRALYATKQQVRDEKRQNAEQEEIEARLEAHAQLAERDSTSPNTEQLLLGVGATSKSFVAAGGLWFVILLSALSVAWLPVGEAINGGGALPLSENWFELFKRAGASWQELGNGFAIPADPFNWVLLAIGSVTFWSPSVALTALVFLAKPIAFFGSFKAFSLFTKKSWIRNVAALSYALLPTVTEAQTQLRIPALIAQLVLPLLVFCIAKVALFGVELSVRSRQQIWTWVGLSGLLFAVEIAAAPNTAAVLLLALVFVLIARIKRFGYLVWIALPTSAIFGPLFIYDLLTHPLAVFADPGVPQGTSNSSGWQLLLGATANPLGLWYLTLFVGVLLLLALLALLTARRAVALLSLGLGLAALLSARLVTGLQFPAIGATDGSEYVSGDPRALLALWGLATIAAASIALESIRRRRALQVVATALVTLCLLPLAALTAVAAPEAKWGSARVMPALIAAQATSGVDVQVLVINSAKSGLTAAVIPANGIQLEDNSTAYRYAVAKQSDYTVSVGQLTADLISGGSDHVSSAFASENIGYVLVPKSAQIESIDVATSLDAVTELESAGETEFGKIWRVRDFKAEAVITDASPWSITKGLQLAVLVSFILLAIPTSGRKRSAGTAEIFVDAGDSND